MNEKLTPVYSEYLNDVGKEYATGIAQEHSYRSALKTLVESLEAGIIAVNEPKRIDCGAPDYVIKRGEVTVGYIEAKDIGVNLNEIEKSEQLKRYFKSLSNLVLTDYLEFRWYVNGDIRLSARLGAPAEGGKIKHDKEGIAEVASLFDSFLAHTAEKVGTPKELAEKMARLAHMVRDLIIKAFNTEDENGALHSQLAAFQENLIPDLSAEQFADMYAQTIAYGLFAARCTAPENRNFTRQNAAYLLPKTNPFLRKLFNNIAGPDLDDRIAWLVDDLAQVLAQADMEAVLKNFGKHSGKEDPVVHFYETFLKAYDPKVREMRGVYYTPEPVVSYIVRSIDYLLKTRFNKPQGLADDNTLILDPATGTATFLYNVINEIHQSFAGQEGMWNDYVAEKLLKRIFGFELLMAPYAVAHLKLGLLLQETGYKFHSDERLGIYLTNTLDEAVKHSETLFAKWISEEANAAAEIKKERPIMVVLGNPPYSGSSANKGEWIRQLIETYKTVDGKPLGEKNPKMLQDDYVKFIRFGQWRIEKTGQGILGFITNHGYIDNITFRGMRQSLMNTFTDIYILNLHGNSKKKEVAPDGGKDENVFDIQQGVAIGIFVKEQGKNSPARVHYADLWGLREGKYKSLFENSVENTEWVELTPNSPDYFFLPRNINYLNEYANGWKVNDIFLINNAGLYTSRDKLTIHSSKKEVEDLIHDFASLLPEVARDKYQLGEDVDDWKVSLAQKDLIDTGLKSERIVSILYRPFDLRYTYYTGNSRGFHCRPRIDIMRHMLAGNNIGLIVNRQIATEGFNHAWLTRLLVDYHILETANANAYLFPLYLYPAEGEMNFDGNERRPNLNADFIKELEGKLGMGFRPHPFEFPSPSTERGYDVAGVSSPSLRAERELEGEVSDWHTKPELWEKLKPVARQMRKEPTPAEDIMWQHLRDRQLLGFKFRRQHSIERFILDFYCSEAALVIEIDGPIHQYSKEEDAIRQEYIESYGLRFLRFTNDDVINNLESVLSRISDELRKPHPFNSPKTSSPCPPSPKSEKGVTSYSPSLHAEREPEGEVFTPEDIFNYAYAIFHSPTYRTRYAEFLKIDFPRLPLTSDKELFRSLAEKGSELVSLHLMESPVLNTPITKYPVDGSHKVEKVEYNEDNRRVYINKTQYFEGVPPEVWNFHIGGYQVCHKWLKDRKDRTLSYDERVHYQKIVVALKETIRLMEGIDEIIPGWPIE
jgi:predicted helicase/very-short-patch-repair endonuclease